MRACVCWNAYTVSISVCGDGVSINVDPISIYNSGYNVMRSH